MNLVNKRKRAIKTLKILFGSIGLICFAVLIAFFGFDFYEKWFYITMLGLMSAILISILFINAIILPKIKKKELNHFMEATTLNFEKCKKDITKFTSNGFSTVKVIFNEEKLKIVDLVLDENKKPIIKNINILNVNNYKGCESFNKELFNKIEDVFAVTFKELDYTQLRVKLHSNRKNINAVPELMLNIAYNDNLADDFMIDFSQEVLYQFITHGVQVDGLEKLKGKVVASKQKKLDKLRVYEKDNSKATAGIVLSCISYLCFACLMPKWIPIFTAMLIAFLSFFISKIINYERVTIYDDYISDTTYCIERKDIFCIEIDKKTYFIDGKLKTFVFYIIISPLHSFIVRKTEENEQKLLKYFDKSIFKVNEETI